MCVWEESPHAVSSSRVYFTWTFLQGLGGGDNDITQHKLKIESSCICLQDPTQREDPWLEGLEGHKGPEPQGS